MGIVFPVYFGDAPDFVTDALEGLTFPGTPYLFAVATSGTSFGAAFQSIDNALQKKGQHLAFAAHLAMVANSTPAVRQHIAYAYEKLVTAEKALPQLVQKIKDRTSDRSLIKGSLMASFSGLPWGSPWADAGSVLVWMRRAASNVVFACAFVR